MDATHGHDAAPGTAAAHDGHDDIQKHVRVYVMVFIALACLTAVTVGASYINMGSHSINIAVALLIAGIKASLVAAFFMHLVSERKVIYWVLGLTALFFVFVLFVPLMTVMENHAAHTTQTVSATAHPAEGHAAPAHPGHGG